jgi:outer membrane protein
MRSSKIILTGLLSLLYAANSYAVTLGESFNSALLNNQDDNINESRLRQSNEALNSSHGTYLPTLSIRGTYLKQKLYDDQKTLGLNLSTSLYNGGRDSKQIENAETAIQISKNQREIDRVNLYMEVVDAYYNYVLSANDIKNLDLLRKQSQERVDEIRKRLQIGRSRKGELLQAEAQLASVEAQASDGLGLLKQNESRLTILTGLNKSQITDIKMESLSPAKSLDEYLALALEREDVQNKNLEIKQLQGEVKIADSYYLPKLDLLSNWYALKEGGSTGNKNSDWDVGLNLIIPLYEAGVSQANARATVEKKISADYALTDYKKSIKIDVASRYETYHRYSDQTKAFDTALDKAKKSYEETLKDYRLGLVANLDVISSLNLYLDSKRNFDKIKIQAVLNQKLLEAAAGMIPQS